LAANDTTRLCQLSKDFEIGEISACWIPALSIER